MDNELLQEIQHELEKLHRNVEAFREEGHDQKTIEQRTNLFEMEWLERLVEEQRAETRGAKNGVEAVFEDRRRQEQLEREARDQQDARQIADKSPEEQVAFWNRSRPGDGTSVLEEQERAREFNRIVQGEETRIKDDYAVLRRDLIRAVQQIEIGYKPSLSHTLAEQMQKEEGRAEAPTQKALQSAAIGSDEFKVALEKEKAEIEKMRQNEMQLARGFKMSR